MKQKFFAFLVISVFLFNTIAFAGRKPVGMYKTVHAPGTAVALGGDVLYKELTICAKEGNLGDIVVGGDSSVVAAYATRKGTRLVAGACRTYYADETQGNLQDHFIDAENKDEGVDAEYYKAI